MNKFEKIIRWLFLSKYQSKKIKKLQNKNSYEPFQHLNEITNHYKLTNGEDYYEYLVEKGFLDNNYKPIKCKECGSSNLFDYVGLDTWTATGKKSLSEEVRCNHCGNYQGEYLFGRWVTT